MDWLADFHFLRPLWLWSLLPGLLLTGVLWRSRRHSGGWEQVIDADLLPELLEASGPVGRRRWPTLLLVSWVLASLAAAGPSFRQLPQPVEQPTDALVLLLDLSYSMKSTDLAPSRMDRGRQKLIDLLERRSAGQTALVAWAGDAHVVTPLTDDHRTIANLLPALNPDMMPMPGSNAPAAVSRGLTLLASAGIPWGHLILVTDGVQPEQVALIRQQLEGSGSRLSVLAIGTPEGAPLPLPRGGFLRDRNGEIVIPGLDAAPLRRLAEVGGGRYSELRVDGGDLDYLLDRGLFSAAESAEATSLQADTWEDQGYWLVLLLLPLVAAGFRRGWLLVLVPLLVLPCTPLPAYAQSAPSPEAAQAAPQPESAGTAETGWQDWWLRPDQQALRALQSGQPERAASLFEDPAWRGTASYRAGHYQAAAEAFAAGDGADAWYNRGNALARAGELAAAAEAYRESLQRAPDSPDAKANLSLVEELLKQEQQDPQQPQSGQDQDGARGEQQPPENRDADAGEDSSSAGAGDSGGDAASRQGKPGAEPPGDPTPGDDDQGGAGSQPSSPGPEENPWAAAARPEAGEEGDGEAEDTAPPLPRFTPEEAERRQALEQWLRRVPDDPSGLLREKFRHQSRQQQRARPRNDDAPYW